MVDDYRIARHAQEIAEEAETLGYAAETRTYRAEHGGPITFKEWLIGLRESRECDDAA